MGARPGRGFRLPVRGHFNRLFASAQALFTSVQDVPGHPALKLPSQGSFVVRNIYTDFKRHDLGPAFHEREYDGTVRRAFLTTPLWGVGSTAPYGHDWRSRPRAVANSPPGRSLIVDHRRAAPRRNSSRCSVVGCSSTARMVQFLRRQLI